MDTMVQDPMDQNQMDQDPMEDPMDQMVQSDVYKAHNDAYHQIVTFVPLTNKD